MGTIFLLAVNRRLHVARVSPCWVSVRCQLVSNDLAVFHHEFYAFQLRDICDWVACDRNEVGELA